MRTESVLIYITTEARQRESCFDPSETGEYGPPRRGSAGCRSQGHPQDRPAALEGWVGPPIRLRGRRANRSALRCQGVHAGLPVLKRAALGFRAHSGWAALVALGG